ncbi:kelch-like protein 10 [Rhipicephalus sanguineus]|uniref:kelch-like protein 10 n=1 Tax=Rhipicephalus sanguineus TaxID=34632 RepID=UPI0018960CB5|nr:kelch-like protein 10 [Rhipicephalus sanguineus]
MHRKVRIGRSFEAAVVLSKPYIQASARLSNMAPSTRERNVSITGKSLDVGEVAGINLSHKMWMTPRVPKHIIFVFGGWTVGAVNNMHTYNCRAVKWRDMGNMYTSPRCYHGVAVINQCIYVVGGFNGREIYHSVVCFDVTLNRWTSKANMEFPRCYVSVAVLKGHIYAMGGYDGRQRFKTVERYDVNANHWTQLADMNDIRSDAGAAVAHGRVYIAGGFTGWTVLESVEFYDPSTNVWTRVQSMPWRRSGHKLVAHKGIIYVIGGYNGTSRVSTRHCKLVKRAIAHSALQKALCNSCHHKVDAAFSEQVSRLKVAGFTQDVVSSVAEGLLRDVKDPRR